MPSSENHLRATLVWYCLKLPLTYATIPLGLLFDFLTGLPFRIAMILDRQPVHRSNDRSGE
jgi:hypothetical protein